MTQPFAAIQDDVLARMVSNVTKTMLGMSFQPAPLGDGRRQLDEWMTVLSLSGKKPVCIAISTTPASCVALSAAMLALQPAEVDESMAHDSLKEILNMAAAQIRSAIAVDQALGLPHFRRGASIDDPSAWRIMRLSSGKIDILLWLSDRALNEHKERTP